MWQEILSIFLLILLNSAFALTETAMMTSRKVRVQHQADQGHRSYKHLLKVMEEPANFLSTIQVAISLIGIFAGALGGATLSDEVARLLVGIGLGTELAGTLSLVAVVLGTTYLSVVVGELVPKRLALGNPEPIAVVMQYPILVISVVFFPLVRLLAGSSNLILRIMGIKAQSDTSVSQQELRILVAEGAEAGMLERLEHHLLDEVLLLGDRKVTAFMRPRVSVACVREDASDRELLDFVRAHVGEDALPVVHGDIDHLVAMVDIRLALASLAANGTINRRDCFRLPVVIPGSYDALKTLELLAAREVQDTAVVLDEFGGVEGIVCLQDILEALVSSGPVPVLATENQAGTSTETVHEILLPLELDGSTPLSELTRLFDLSELLPEGDYETLAGLYLTLSGQIPAAGDEVELGDLVLHVLEMDRHRVSRVRIQGALDSDGTARDGE